MKDIISLFIVTLCSTALFAQTTYTTTVSSENQQVVKGLGGGLPWPSAGCGFPITDHPDGMELLLDMGISVARIYWHNQASLFDENGDPTTRGQTLIKGVVEEVRWLNENKIPYNMDGGINNMPRDCYFNDGATGHLLPEYEQALAKSMLHVLNAIKEAGLELPMVVVPFNEPSAPISISNRGPQTGSMSRDQLVRIIKLFRTELDKAGYKDVLLGFSENGQPMYANFYAGNDIGGSRSAYGGLFVNVANDEKLWPFFNPASPRYDAELDKAVGAFTCHGYYPGVGDINDYVAGYHLTNKGRDNWQTEYCLWGGNYNDIPANYNQEVLRKFISDMAFFQFNYWEFWNIWNTSSPAPCTDILCGGSDRQNRKPAAYYALRKVFKNITPGETYVRRIDSDIPDFRVANASAMNAVAFVSSNKTVVVLINSSANNVSTNLKGLFGKSAEVFQIDGTDKNLFNTDLTLAGTSVITEGVIDKIDLPAGTITIVVTNGGNDRDYQIAAWPPEDTEFDFYDAPGFTLLPSSRKTWVGQKPMVSFFDSLCQISKKATLYHENGKLAFHTKSRGHRGRAATPWPPFSPAFVPLCETKTATVLFINNLHITCCDIIYPLCCYSAEKAVF